MRNHRKSIVEFIERRADALGTYEGTPGAVKHSSGSALLRALASDIAAKLDIPAAPVDETPAS